MANISETLINEEDQLFDYEDTIDDVEILNEDELLKDTNSPKKEEAPKNHIQLRQSLADLNKLEFLMKKPRASCTNIPAPIIPLDEVKKADEKSIYVGNVNYGTTPVELAQFFSTCGTINRITIPCHKGGQQKGFAYVEFDEKEAVNTALTNLNGSEFRGRSIKIQAKRTNRPGMNETNKKFVPSFRRTSNKPQYRGAIHRNYGNIAHSHMKGNRTKPY